MLSLSIDAHTASMAAAAETAVDSTTRDAMRLGDTVTWRARHFGIWFRMTSAITVYEHPARFVDEQVSGQFSYWRHEHRFERIPTGGTRMVDAVNYRSPAGPLGGMADLLVLSRYLRGLIESATPG
jgi:ligand-binding SRPBCC domain-containing protein